MIRAEFQRLHSPHPRRNGFSFSRKTCNIKNIGNLVTLKKSYIRFRRQTHPSLGKGFGPPWKLLFAIFLENTGFFSEKWSAIGNKKGLYYIPLDTKTSGGKTSRG